jgi:hypothetical protein
MNEPDLPLGLRPQPRSHRRRGKWKMVDEEPLECSGCRRAGLSSNQELTWSSSTDLACDWLVVWLYAVLGVPDGEKGTLDR